MTKVFLYSLCIAALCWSSGCLFSRKGSRAKENSAIAADVEENFRKRWVEKRVNELVAQGVAADAANAQAETEFAQRYEYTLPARK